MLTPNSLIKRAAALVLAAQLIVTPAFAGTSQAPTTAAALPLQTAPAARVAAVLQRLFPHDRISVESNANAVVVRGAASDVDAMRQIATALDVKNPSESTADVIPLQGNEGTATAARLRELFPKSRFVTGPNHTLVVSGTSQDLTQIKTIVAAIEAAKPTPAPAASPQIESIRMSQANASSVARVVAKAVPHTRVDVAGSTIVLRGATDDVARAKQLLEQLDEPPSGVRYTQVYRLRFVDAASVGDLLKRSLPGIEVQTDKDLNALSVLATYAQHKHIADAIAQLDGNPTAAQMPTGQPGSVANAGALGGLDTEVVTLRAAIPGLNGAASTSATDIAQTISQALQNSAPDLHVTVPPNSTQLVLTGTPYSISLAKRLVAQLDVTQPLVVLDTEILEVDETVAKNLGLQFTSPLVTSTFTEITPSGDAFGNPQPLRGLQPFSRTALSFGLQMNLLVQKGQARILADPRITVISGRTASIRAGDTISILTTTGGGAGTVATTQLQSFQTGVTLDITPVVNVENYISVTLHPTVNSLEGVLNGVPQIATRDAQTTVGLQEDQTLIIGGLIQDSTNRTESRIPILGDLPVVGRAFRNSTVNNNRNELVVAVTPHILKPGQGYVSPGPALPNAPTPQPLPTLPPQTVLPAQRAQVSSSAAVTATPAQAPLVTPQPAAPSPQPSTSPTPKAFSELNVFTYGQAPQNNYAASGAPAQIFTVRLTPTVLHGPTSVTVSAITTTNVKSLTLSYGQVKIPIAQTSAGVWESSFKFDTGGSLRGSTALILSGTKDDRSTVTLSIPVTISN